MQYRKKYRIESARMPGWDYSTPGYYFVTVCTHDHRHLFGAVVDHAMICNEFGTIVQNEWNRTGAINRYIVLDTFVVMPNHFHAIIQILPRIGHPAGNDFIAITPGNANPNPIALSRTDVARNVSTLHTAIIDNTEIIAASTPENANPNPIALSRTDVARNVSADPIPPKNEQMAAISPARGSLPAIMRSLKSAICKQINEIRNTPGAPVLQFRFHDHIIRNDQELFRIRQYIRNNPRKWRKDTFNAHDDFSVRETENDDDQEIWMI